MLEAPEQPSGQEQAAMPGKDTTLWAQTCSASYRFVNASQMCISNSQRSCSYCTAQSDRSQGAILFILVTKFIRQPGTTVLKIRSGAKLEKMQLKSSAEGNMGTAVDLTQTPRNEQVWLLSFRAYFPVSDAIPRH